MRELSLNVMDIAQNSIEAHSTLIKIQVCENTRKNRLTIEISDNGVGIDKNNLKKIFSPFYTTRKSRKVGLGIPLFKMAAEATGGGLRIHSDQNTGTTVTATFVTSSIDMTPLGDINSTIAILIKCNPKVDFIFTHIIDDSSLTLNTLEIKKELGNNIGIQEALVVTWIQKYLAEQTQLLLGGTAYNEIT